MSAAIRPGSYRCRATPESGEWVESGQTDALSIELTILDRGAELGKMRTRLKFGDEKSVKFSGLKLRALGVRGADLFELAGLGEREADVEVERVSYQGREFLAANVKVVAAAAPLDESRKEALRERLRAIASEVPDLPPEEPSASAPSSSDDDFSTDDLPF